MRLWQRRSVRTRLAVIAGVVMALMCVAASVAVLFTVHGTAQAYTTRAVVDTAERLGYASVHEPLPPVMLDETVAGVQVIDRRGRIVSTTAGIAGRPRMADVRPSGPGSQVLPSECGSPAFPGRCMTVAAFRVPGGESGHVVYAADYDVPWHVSNRLLATLICITSALTVLTACGTYLAVRRALAPVDAVTEKLATITATDLSRRVPVSKFRDELRRLAEAANQTLDRAELAVEQQRRFASDVSHDLRSPLTAMRAEIEGAMLDPEHADWRATGDALLDSLDRLQAMVADLLRLARLDAGAAQPEPERIDLAGLAARELDRRPRKVEVVRDLMPGVIVTGDRLSLARLLGNLLDNGERHAASMLWVTVRQEDGAAILEVQDDGSGVPPECREVVFQRFTRLDQAREKDAGGTGLGLSIARQIAQTHNGTLTIEDSAVGARFVLRLPAAPP
ncbi:sensor histidine kinase [Sphaerimonospora mesophila]|uniref:sensor histidine kinase n=1 Tax=Sphaerimonospora mesophila TaxID=37483 RepID=UPI000A4151EA